MGPILFLVLLPIGSANRRGADCPAAPAATSGNPRTPPTVAHATRAKTTTPQPTRVARPAGNGVGQQPARADLWQSCVVVSSQPARAEAWQVAERTNRNQRVQTCGAGLARLLHGARFVPNIVACPSLARFVPNIVACPSLARFVPNIVACRQFCKHRAKHLGNRHVRDA
jgi:hypothetical protein